MKAYVGETVEDKPHKRNSVRLAIRKVGRLHSTASLSWVRFVIISILP